MINEIFFTVNQQESGRRLDIFLAQKINELESEDETFSTRSKVQKHILSGNVFINDKEVKHKSAILSEGDVVSLVPLTKEEINPTPQNIALKIIYEDSDIIIINKEKGMVVHPAKGNVDGTLVNALLFRFKDELSTLSGSTRPGIVHRIDKNTSGILVIAKNDFTHVKLSEKFKNHDFVRRYEAVVYGKFKKTQGTIIAPLGRDPYSRIKRAVGVPFSKEAITHYKVLDNYIDEETNKEFSHIELELETGRTHQIRVHMSYIGHPIAGDDVYGPKDVITELNGQCLHAKYIGFTHPRSGFYLEVESDLPNYFTNFLKKLRKV